MPKKIADTQVVKQIIDKGLLTSLSVHKYWVVEKIKDRIHPSRLHNKVRTYSSERSDGETDSGIVNMHRGSQKVFRDSMKSLKKQGYSEDKEGLITKKEVSEEAPRSVLDLFEHDGQLKTLQEWFETPQCQKLGISYDALRHRMVRSGWSVEKALTTPVACNSDKDWMNLITSEWIDRKELGDHIDEDEAIAVAKSREKVDERLLKKKGKTAKKRSRKERIKTGRGIIITQVIFRLSKEGLIEKNGIFGGAVRSVK